MELPFRMELSLGSETELFIGLPMGPLIYLKPLVSRRHPTVGVTTLESDLQKQMTPQAWRGQKATMPR
jgi:hypothetical protein